MGVNYHQRNRDGGVTPPPRTHIELRSPHRRAASPGTATNVSEAQSRKHPPKLHENSRSLHSDRKGKGRAVAPSTSEEENSISAYSSEQGPSTSHVRFKLLPTKREANLLFQRQVMREDFDRERRLSQRLREKVRTHFLRAARFALWLRRISDEIASMEEDVRISASPAWRCAAKRLSQEQALQARYDADHKSWSTKALELESENTLLTERVQDAVRSFH
jgi:hypothetical protein